MLERPWATTCVCVCVCVCARARVCLCTYVQIFHGNLQEASQPFCAALVAPDGGESQERDPNEVFLKVHRRVHRAQKYSALSHHAYAISFCASEKGRRQTDRERVRERKQLEGSRGRRREGHVVVQAHDARDKLSLTDRQNMYCVI